jgi:hypothetical protein
MELKIVHINRYDKSQLRKPRYHLTAQNPGFILSMTCAIIIDVIFTQQDLLRLNARSCAKKLFNAFKY